jgi:2-haloacid dehalogenase
MKTDALRALTFDHYGTLFDKEAVSALIDERLPGRGLQLARLWFQTTQRYCWLNGMMGRHQTWDDLTRRALDFAFRSEGLELDPALADALMDADIDLPPYAEVPAALALLAQHFDLWVLSMGSPWMIERSQEKAGIKSLFKGIVSAERAKIYKPAPGAYGLAERVLGLAMEEIGFVSSNSFDVMGSANYGYPTFWVNRRGLPLDPLGPEPDCEVPDLMVLAERLTTGHPVRLRPTTQPAI